MKLEDFLDLKTTNRREQHYVRLPRAGLITAMLQVVDANSGRITMTHTDATWTTDGGQMDYPVHVTVDSDGFIYVLDGHNRSIQLFDADLRHLRDLLDEQRGLREPRKMCVDGQNGRLYVAEGAGNVLVFDII